MLTRIGRFDGWDRTTCHSVGVLAALVGFLPLSAWAKEPSTGGRSSRDDGRNRPDAADTLRARAATEEGILVVYDAPVPEDIEYDAPPFFLIWRDNFSGQLLLHSRLVFDRADVADAVRTLGKELGLNRSSVEELLEACAGEEGSDHTLRHGSRNRADTWNSLTWNALLRLTGFDPGDWPKPDGFEESGAAGSVVADQGGCRPILVAVPPVPAPGSVKNPKTLFPTAVSSAPCPGGGSDPPDGPPDGPPPPQDCEGDKDCDGIMNYNDPDVDGDGASNGQDDDVDGDGIPNGSDSDVDGDGIANGDDPDIDGDGVSNGNDDDMDGDGTSNGADGDMDGDNDSDDDVDGDGIGDGGDSDVDGDGTPNIEDPDIDGDGTLNEDDDAPGGGEGGCTTNCKGACCDKDTGACTLKKESGCGAGNQHFQGTGIGCSPNPCCAEGQDQPFNVNAVSIHQVPPSGPLAVGELGVTVIERIDVTISAICDGEFWCATLTDLRGYYSVQVDIAPLTQITGVGGNTTEQTYCDQVHDLFSLAVSPQLWYLASAVWAHEQVHVSHLDDALREVAPEIEQIIESLCIPHSAGLTQVEAVQDLRSVPAFSEQLQGNAMNVWARRNLDWVAMDHAIGGPCIQVEHSIADPMAIQFCAHADNVCWQYCDGCGPRPEGACCNTGNGDCSVLTECECLDRGRLYRGDGWACSPGRQCMGACCQDPNVAPYPCYLEARDRCGGWFHGEGTVCAPNPCVPPGRSRARIKGDEPSWNGSPKEEP